MIQHVNFVLFDMTKHKTLHAIGGMIIAFGALALIITGSFFLSWSIRSSYREQVREVIQQQDIPTTTVRIVDGIFVPVLVVIAPGERVSFLNTDQQAYTLVCEEEVNRIEPSMRIERILYVPGEYQCSLPSHTHTSIVR